MLTKELICHHLNTNCIYDKTQKKKFKKKILKKMAPTLIWIGVKMKINDDVYHDVFAVD